MLSFLQMLGYIEFATANQFWMMAIYAEANFNDVRDASRFENAQDADFPAVGFTAVPTFLRIRCDLLRFPSNTVAFGSFLRWSTHRELLQNYLSPLLCGCGLYLSVVE